MTLAVVGANHPNQEGGVPRRFEIEMCKPGEAVELRHEPKNEFDRNAIAVFSARGIQIGYVRAERAPLILTYMRREGVTAIFQNVEPWGCNIRIAVGEGEPTLPDPSGSRAHDWPPPDPDDGFYPDPVYDD